MLNLGSGRFLPVHFSSFLIVHVRQHGDNIFWDSSVALALLDTEIEQRPCQTETAATHEAETIAGISPHYQNGEDLLDGVREFPLEVLEVVGARAAMVTFEPAPNHLDEVQLTVVLGEDQNLQMECQTRHGFCAIKSGCWAR